MSKTFQTAEGHFNVTWKPCWVLHLGFSSCTLRPSLSPRPWADFAHRSLPEMT